MLFQGIVKQALGVLKALAGNDDIKIAIVKAEGVQLILAAMTQHQGTQNLRVVMTCIKHTMIIILLIPYILIGLLNNNQ